MRVPAPQELMFSPALTVLRAAKPILCGAASNSADAFDVMTHAQRGPVWSPAVLGVARGAVLAGCGAFGVGYSVLLSAGAMQPHTRSSSNFSCSGRAKARR